MDQGVSPGIAVYRSGTHNKSLKYRLNYKCTNNQAEQLAILKSLEHIDTTHTSDKAVTIYTDSRTSLDSLLNNNIHMYLMDKIRRKVRELTQTEWKIQICWVKAHAGLQGNELADTLAKTAAMDLDVPECFNRILKVYLKPISGLKELKNGRETGSKPPRARPPKSISRLWLRD